MIILVGGAGFIGHHLALTLKMAGKDVMILDPMIVNNKYAVMDDPKLAAIIAEREALLDQWKVPVISADARDYDMISHIFRHHKPHAVVHLAAISHIDRANKDPMSTFDHNLRTLENSLDASRATGCERFVFFSSSTVYGNFKKPVLDETEPCEPKGIYGSLKLAGELIVKAYGDVYGLPWTIIRPMAAYGSRCVSGRVTQKFIEQAIAGSPLKIEGDGSSRVDFTHIKDIVRGVILALGKPAAANQIFNITAGESMSLLELAEIVQKHFPKTEIEYGPPDPQRPRRGALSIEKAKELLGFEPKWRLAEGMADYIGWYRNAG